jgi:hypothetical protein
VTELRLTDERWPLDRFPMCGVGKYSGVLLPPVTGRRKPRWRYGEAAFDYYQSHEQIARIQEREVPALADDEVR